MLRLRWLMIAVGLLAGWAAAARAETRLALVVGNAKYAHTAPLGNPINDARDMTAALKHAGFEVIEAIDADKRRFDDAVRGFANRLAKVDVALFFYAGHGLQVGAQNYLVPIDARLGTERDLEFESVRLDFVLRQMEIDREGKTSIVILDACRDNPLSRNLARSMGTRSASIGRGLAAASTGLGTFIAYSTQPGNVALDGEGRNSPFAAALVKHMGVQGRNLPATMIEVRKAVVAATGGKQVPWDHSALTGDFYFLPGAAGSAAPGQSADVAALQARLRKLEDDARQRETAAAAAKRPAPPPSEPWQAPANAHVAAAIPPVTPKATVPRVSPNFEETDAVALRGVEIGEPFRAPSPIACREACDKNAACVGFQHGRRIPVMGSCQLFSRIDARDQDNNWRSGVRVSPAASAIGGLASKVPGLQGVAPTTIDRGFATYRGISLIGNAIKTAGADSPAACVIVCRNTPGCVGATFDPSLAGTTITCSVMYDVRQAVGSNNSTAILKAD